MISKNEVKEQAKGRWDYIVSQLAPFVLPAIDRPGMMHIDCPIHGGSKDFRVYKDFLETGGAVCTCGNYPDGIALVMAVNDWTFKDSLSEISRVLGGIKTRIPIKTVPKRNIEKEDAAIRHRLSALWKNGVSVTDNKAWVFREYLKNRGLDFPAGLSLKNLRFNPAMAYYEKGVFIGHFPGLMACVKSPDGQPITIHRTFLSKEGKKAPVESPKKLCSHASDRLLQGAAIRLFDVADTLAVAEGIETALAVTQLTGIPCWATVTAGLMEAFVPPEGITSVKIYADKDSPSRFHPEGYGLEAAKALCARLLKTGITASIELPSQAIPSEKKGIDWLDVLVGVNALKVA